ncbi:N-acetyltransferase [Micromonospora sp. ATA51]|uniref:N-acetyltransferase n=1 Tax=Micromonospora sp. ATA51 TaxID=2806098 RepID=UPI001A552633|nr:N-acetyltransferase [Micromonospora sp. ATA51]MBM0225891.1 N-acetyltransferase [Micromonospora sp. ATA51]
MAAIPPAVPARWCDTTHIAGLVADALHSSAIGAWLVPDDDRRRQVLTAISAVWVEHALLFGEVYLLVDRSATAVWFHRHRPIPPPAGYRERLAHACGDHLDRFRALDRVLKAHRPADAHNHLAFLAVPSATWRHARATALLARSLVRMDRLVPSYVGGHHSRRGCPLRSPRLHRLRSVRAPRRHDGPRTVASTGGTLRCPGGAIADQPTRMDLGQMRVTTSRTGQAGTPSCRPILAAPGPRLDAGSAARAPALPAQLIIPARPAVDS